METLFDIGVEREPDDIKPDKWPEIIAADKAWRERWYRTQYVPRPFNEERFEMLMGRKSYDMTQVRANIAADVERLKANDHDHHA